MLTFDRRAARGAKAPATMTLDYESRRRCRLKARLDSGEEVGVVLGWGETLRPGDVLSTADGRLVCIAAARERVMVVRCSHARELARVAYHLGNRHVAVELGDGALKLAPDPVLKAMVEGLGAEVQLSDEPFEPEAGAYAPHGHGPAAARITGSRQAG